MSTKPAISPKRCKIGPKLLWRTNRKSHVSFRFVPKSMTLDDLERTKRNLAEKKLFYGAQQKNLNEDRPIFSAEKCMSIILVSRNIRYMRIFAKVPRGGESKQWGCRRRHFWLNLTAQTEEFSVSVRFAASCNSYLAVMHFLTDQSAV